MAHNAANAARRAASQVAEASEMASIQANGDHARADQAVSKAQDAEDAARQRLLTAEGESFSPAPS